MTRLIEELSSWFCFVYCTKGFIEFGHSYQLPINEKRFGEIISKLCEMYREELIPVAETILDLRECDDFNFYMTVILSKCVKLSPTATKLNFLLVCTFIQLIIWLRFQCRRKCFTFVKIASQCLVSIYDRRYSNIFKGKDGAKKFDSYCIDINTLLASRLTAKGRKALSPFNRPKVAKMMEDVKIMDYKKFKLTEAELSMLNETLSFLPDRDFSIDDDTSSTGSTSDMEFLKEDEFGSEEVYVKVELDTDESESDDVCLKVEVDTSDPDEIHMRLEIEADENEVPEIYVKQEIGESEMESSEMYMKEAKINETKYGRAFSKGESSANDFKSCETSSNEESTSVSTEKFKMDENNSDFTSRICKYCGWICLEFVAFCGKVLLVESENSE